MEFLFISILDLFFQTIQETFDLKLHLLNSQMTWFWIFTWCKIDATRWRSRFIRVLSFSESMCSFFLVFSVDSNFWSYLHSPISDFVNCSFICNWVSWLALFFKYVSIFELLALDDPQKAILALQQRLEVQQPYSEFTKNLIQQSIGSWTTHWYDQFQFYMTGIFWYSLFVEISTSLGRFFHSLFIVVYKRGSW